MRGWAWSPGYSGKQIPERRVEGTAPKTGKLGLRTTGKDRDSLFGTMVPRYPWVDGGSMAGLGSECKGGLPCVAWAGKGKGGGERREVPAAAAE